MVGPGKELDLLSDCPSPVFPPLAHTTFLLLSFFTGAYNNSLFDLLLPPLPK